jgi:hypothetical protein
VPIKASCNVQVTAGVIDAAAEADTRGGPEPRNAGVRQVGSCVLERLHLAVDVKLSMIRADASLPLCFVKVVVPSVLVRVDAEQLAAIVGKARRDAHVGGTLKAAHKGGRRRNRSLDLMTRMALRAQTGRTPTGYTPSIRSASRVSDVSLLDAMCLPASPSPRLPSRHARVPSRDWLNSSVHAALEHEALQLQHPLLPPPAPAGSDVAKCGLRTPSPMASSPSATPPLPSPLSLPESPVVQAAANKGRLGLTPEARGGSGAPAEEEEGCSWQGALRQADVAASRPTSEAPDASAAPITLHSPTNQRTAPEQVPGNAPAMGAGGGVAGTDMPSGSRQRQAAGACPHPSAAPDVAAAAAAAPAPGQGNMAAGAGDGMGAGDGGEQAGPDAASRAAQAQSRWRWSSLLAWRSARSGHDAAAAGAPDWTASGLDVTQGAASPGNTQEEGQAAQGEEADPAGATQWGSAPRSDAAAASASAGRPWLSLTRADTGGDSGGVRGWWRRRMQPSSAAGAAHATRSSGEREGGQAAGMAAGEGGEEGQVPGGGGAGSPAHGGETSSHRDMTAASAAAPSTTGILSTVSTKRRAADASPSALPPSGSSPLQHALDAPAALAAPRFSLLERSPAPGALGAAWGGQGAESDKAAAAATATAQSSSAMVISKTERLMETWERSIHSLNTLFKPAARQQDLEADAAAKVLALAAHTRLAAFTALTSTGLAWADASWRQRLEACLAVQPAAPVLERATSNASLVDGLVDPDGLPRLRDRHRASSLVLPRPPGHVSSDTVPSRFPLCPLILCFVPLPPLPLDSVLCSASPFAP